MKSVNFKRKESVIRSIEMTEHNLARRPFNWDRIVYLIILFIFLFIVGKYLINKWLYIEGNGQVLFDSVDIRNTNDSRIIKFFVEEGDEVRKGERLFSFSPADEMGGYGDPSSEKYQKLQEKKSTGDLSWAEKEIFTVEQKLKFNAVQLTSKKNLLKSYQSELERIKNAVALDAMPSYRLDDQYNLITKIQLEIQNLQQEQGILNNEIELLRGMVRDLGGTTKNASERERFYNGNGRGNGNGSKNPKNIFYSPLDGTVTNMLKKEFEVALKSESILSLHKPKNVYIKAFFPQEDLKWLDEGQLVQLTFPDGTTSKGMIKRFYFATYRLPEEFQKKYEPTTRSLSADIYPVNNKDLYKWKAYWKMGVEISKYKY
jgi:multidrug resistance efflux pump